MSNNDPLVQADTVSSEDITNDLALFQALKPYIGHCLSMNHDINNPLAGILGYCEFMLSEDNELNPSQRRQLQQINKCAERIRKLVEQLCAEKIAITEQIDLRGVIDAYKKIAVKLE